MTHEDDLSDLAGRVQRIERDNRRLKLGAGVLSAVLVAVLVAEPLVAAVAPMQSVIRAREFRVLDEQGTVLAVFGAPGLAFYDEQGTVQATHAPDGLRLYDEQALYARLNADGLVFVDEQGTVLARLPR